MKILVIDDTKFSRYLAVKLLQLLGYEECLEAASVTEAKSLLQEYSDIRLIISDWYMSHNTGLDLLKYVRRHSHYKDIPFIIQTCDTRWSNVMAASKYGLQAYMHKPLSAKSFYKELTTISKDHGIQAPKLLSSDNRSSFLL